MFQDSACPFPAPQRRAGRKPRKAQQGEPEPQAHLRAVARRGNFHGFLHVQRKDGAARRAVGICRNAVIPVSVVFQRDRRGGIACARRAGDRLEAAAPVRIPLVRLRILRRHAQRRRVVHGYGNLLVRGGAGDDGRLSGIGLHGRRLNDDAQLLRIAACAVRRLYFEGERPGGCRRSRDGIAGEGQAVGQAAAVQRPADGRGTRRREGLAVCRACLAALQGGCGDDGRLSGIGLHGRRLNDDAQLLRIAACAVRRLYFEGERPGGCRRSRDGIAGEGQAVGQAAAVQRPADGRGTRRREGLAVCRACLAALQGGCGDDGRLFRCRGGNGRQRACVVGPLIAVELLVEHIQLCRIAQRHAAGERKARRPACAGQLQDAPVVGNRAVLQNDGGKVFVCSGLRAGVGEGKRVSAPLPIGNGKATTGAVLQRQLPLVAAVMFHRRQSVVHAAGGFAAGRGGGEEDVLQIQVEGGAHRGVLVVHRVAFVNIAAIVLDKRRHRIIEAGRAQPPPVQITLIFTIHIGPQPSAIRHIGRIGRGSAAAVLWEITEIVCLRNRQEENAVGGVIAAFTVCSTVIVFVIVIDNRCLHDGILLFGRKGSIQEIVPGIIDAAAPARIRGRVVAVEPGTHRASFPGYVFLFRVILEHVKVLVGKQEQLPARAGQHPPLDGFFRAVVALIVVPEIDVIRLSAADVAGAVVRHELDRLAGIRGKGSRRQHGHHQADCEQGAYPLFRSVFHR